MRKQRNEAQRLGIGEGRDEEAQKFAQGKGGANLAQGKCVVRISHKGNMLCEFRTMHYSPVQMRNCGGFKSQ